MFRLWVRCIESLLGWWVNIIVGLWVRCIESLLGWWAGEGTLWSGYGLGALNAGWLVGRSWGQVSGFSLVGSTVMGLTVGTVETIGSVRWVTLERL
ncbi:hypothetical protein FKM82_016463 [Ascaphus truei]